MLAPMTASSPDDEAAGLIDTDGATLAASTPAPAAEGADRASGPRRTGASEPRAGDDALAATMGATGPGSSPSGTQLRRAIADRGPASEPRAVDPSPRPVTGDGFEDRYDVGSQLGEGGMGEVRRCADLRIGRDVAVKVIRPGDGSRSDARRRFEMEARVQGQLEHPSIVPVYDMGLMPDRTAYFTMKRVHGLTLEQIVDSLRTGDPGAVGAHSQRRLLNVFGQVCLAAAFAHSRGVVHRDLKPSNIILGEFGEVYLLDWGVAKIANAEGPGDAESQPRQEDSPQQAGDVDTRHSDSSGSERTSAGTILGTPGYMAPEQARGAIDEIDARADVYALGAILFELLTLEPLHPRTTTQRMLLATMTGANARISERAPGRDVAPELEAICVRATALDPADRLASARELHEEVERFLDGARDLERRREMADRHAHEAAAAFEEAQGSGPAAAEARARAMRAANAALALDQQHPTALRTLMQLLIAPGDDLPPEAEAELRRARSRDRARTARAAAVGIAALFLLDPLMAWVGIHDYVALVPLLLFMVATALAAYWVSRRVEVTRLHYAIVTVLCAGIAGTTCVMYGPLFFVPTAALAVLFPLAVNLRADALLRRFMMTLGVASFVVPAALQYVGVLPPSYQVREGMLSILPWGLEFPDGPTQIFLVCLGVAMLVVPLWVTGRALDAMASAERRLFVQAHNLKLLVPDDARPADPQDPQDPPSSKACAAG